MRILLARFSNRYGLEGCISGPKDQCINKWYISLFGTCTDAVPLMKSMSRDVRIQVDVQTVYASVLDLPLPVYC